MMPSFLQCFWGAKDEDCAKNGALDDAWCNYLRAGYPGEFCGGNDAIEVKFVNTRRQQLTHEEIAPVLSLFAGRKLMKERK